MDSERFVTPGMDASADQALILRNPRIRDHQLAIRVRQRLIVDRFPLTLLSAMTGRSTLSITSTAIAAVMFACLPLVLAQQNDQAAPRPVATPLRVTEAPTIDGMLNESVWRQAMPLTDFIQADPLEGQAASE